MPTSFSLPILLAAAVGNSQPAATPASAMQEQASADMAALKAQAIAWDDAIVHKRRAGIEVNLAQDFLHIAGDGRLSDRTRFLEALLSDDLSIAPYAMDGLQVRMFGDTAFLTGTTHMHGTWRGQPFVSHYRFTDTYLRRDGRWQVVHVQVTELPSP